MDSPNIIDAPINNLSDTEFLVMLAHLMKIFETPRNAGYKALLKQYNRHHGLDLYEQKPKHEQGVKTDVWTQTEFR